MTEPDAPINLANVPEITNGSQIGLEWEDGASDGGAEVLDYKITWDQGTNDQTVLVEFLNALSYTVTGLTAGVTYAFKVQSRNRIGYSDYSTPVSILAAQGPDTPAAPSTSFIGDWLVVDWTAPASGGSPITAYRIQIRHADEVTYSEELTSCDGTDPTIVDNLQCSIPSYLLNQAPFSLAWGSSVYAKVRAINANGDSPFSPEGNGGVIITNPDAPINLAEDSSERTLNSIGFSWQQG